jgi:acetylornithine deacetylase
VRHVSYVEGRGNILVTYPGSDASAGTLGFVGMHLDVVPANPDTWRVRERVSVLAALCVRAPGAC